MPLSLGLQVPATITLQMPSAGEANKGPRLCRQLIDDKTNFIIIYTDLLFQKVSTLLLLLYNIFLNLKKKYMNY